MPRRPPRQYYDGVDVVVDDDLPLVEPWLRHRRRFIAELAALDDDQWLKTTRCVSWDARGVVAHLVTSTDTLIAAVEELDGDDWHAPCEAPFGHLPDRLVLAHAFWDSWLHERDIFEPLRVEIDSGIRITRAAREQAIASGRAVDLVEHATGRKPESSHAALPPDLAAQLERASQIL